VILIRLCYSHGVTSFYFGLCLCAVLVLRVPHGNLYLCFQICSLAEFFYFNLCAHLCAACDWCGCALRPLSHALFPFGGVLPPPGLPPAPAHKMQNVAFSPPPGGADGRKERFVATSGWVQFVWPWVFLALQYQPGCSQCCFTSQDAARAVVAASMELPAAAIWDMIAGLKRVAGDYLC